MKPGRDYVAIINVKKISSTIPPDWSIITSVSCIILSELSYIYDEFLVTNSRLVLYILVFMSSSQASTGSLK